MKFKKIVTLTFLVLVAASVGANEVRETDPAKMSSLAYKIIYTAELNMIGAKGAAQVSQLADQAQLQLSQIIIRQNDEIVRLLRKMTEDKK